MELSIVLIKRPFHIVFSPLLFIPSIKKENSKKKSRNLFEIIDTFNRINTTYPQRETRVKSKTRACRQARDDDRLSSLKWHTSSHR